MALRTATSPTASPPSSGREDQDCVVCLNSASLHELSSPINQLCSMSDLVLIRYKGTLDNDAELLLGFIRNSAGRLQNLLAGLKTYFDLIEPEGPVRRCRAEDLLRRALATLQPRINEAGAVVTHDVLPELDCDPDQIAFVFASLIDNAIKFRGPESPRIHVGAASSVKAWIISVRDNGIGIDPRHHKSIFGVFKRLNNDRYPGAGMGLAIVMRIAERHHANVRVESAPGEGATVVIEFPKQTNQ